MHVHWADEVAEELVNRGSIHVLETGTSISGIPHIGNASDVIRADAVRKALKERGVDVELIWVADDSDPFRKIPKDMEALREYLGYPVKDIPDPYRCHNNFVDHFVSGFIDELNSYGVKPTVYSGTELYRTGALSSEIKTALENSREIAEILNKYRTEPLPKDYIPWTPICEKCGRISTTKTLSRKKTLIKYVCETTKIAGGVAEGCGHEGEADALKGMGKLPWRIEWAARWHHFKVTCEPLGKEHASAGGSFWTASEICEKIYRHKPPLPVIYEFFTLNGEKISSSKGNVITLKQWSEVCEPEVLKYLMYKRLNKQRDVNMPTIPVLVDEYDEAERLYFSRQEGLDEEAQRMVRGYHLAQITEPKPLNVPYTLCATLSQIVLDLDMDVICMKVKALGYEGFDLDRLRKRITSAKRWVELFGPENLRFRLLSEEESFREYQGLDDVQKKGLNMLVDELNIKQTPEQLHKKIYETARGIGLKPEKMFEAVYRVLTGKDRGPKAAAFMLALGREYVSRRFRPT